MMQREDRSAGNCAPGSLVRDCEKRELGDIAHELDATANGAIVGQEDPIVNVAGVTVAIGSQSDFRTWMIQGGAATIIRGLALWAPVFHRNHRENAAACFTIADASLQGVGDTTAWGIDLGADTDGKPILTETCEGW
jgi:hypothetical protein